MRSSIIKAYSLGMITGSFFTAGAVLLASPAKADPDAVTVAYAAAYGSVVCQVLDEHPTEAGIYGIGEAIYEDGLSYQQAGAVIALSVAEICPRHTALIMQFARSHAGHKVA